MRVVQPVLVIPGGVATEADVEVVNRASVLAQQWWETRNLDLLVYHLRPSAPVVVEDESYFFPPDWYVGTQDATPWYAVWSLLPEWFPNGGRVPDEDIIWLVFLKSPPHDSGTWGWGGANLIVVDYNLVDMLPSATLEAIHTPGNLAMGIITHEEAHTLGWEHPTTEENTLNFNSKQWPEVAIPLSFGDNL